MVSQFCSQCATKLETTNAFCPKCGAKINGSTIEIESDKSAITALLLCLFFGALGIHRFYVGKIWTGILMLITAGGLGIWTLIDLIVIACCRFKDKLGHVLIFTPGKKSPAKTILIVIGSLIGAILVYVVLLISLVMCATSGLVTTVQHQLDALQAGDLNKAYYEYTSKDFQRVTSFDDFKTFINQYPVFTHLKSTSFPEREFKNNYGDLKGTLTATDGSTTSIEYTLIYENKKWKIIAIDIPGRESGIQSKEHKENDESSD